MVNHLLFDSAKETRIQGVRFLELCHILTGKQPTIGTLMQIQQCQSEYLAKIQSRYHLLECLLAWPWRLAVNDDIIRCSWQDLVLIVKGSPLTVDGHGKMRVKVEMCDLGNITAMIHICS